jgi:integrase
MPLLFQRRFGIEHRAIRAATIREWISRALDGSNVTDAAGQSLRFTPHDFRRMFITDAVLHGMPPHIAQLVAGHRDINTTMGASNGRETAGRQVRMALGRCLEDDWDSCLTRADRHAVPSDARYAHQQGWLRWLA